jgi:hypothetical protein
MISSKLSEALGSRKRFGGYSDDAAHDDFTRAAVRLSRFLDIRLPDRW